MKKTISAILLMMLILSAAGCKGTDEEGTPTDTPEETSGTSANESYYKGWYTPSNVSILIVSEKETVFETEKFRLVIPPNNPFHPDIKNLTATLMDDIEKVTGLSFFPAGKSFAKIEITNDGSETPYGGEYGMNADMLSYSFEDTEFTFVHELTHCIQMRNAEIPNRTFVEEYAVITSLKVAQLQGNHILVNQLRQNYQIYPSETLPGNLKGFNIEEFYLNTKEQGWDHYLVGYAFGMYLEDCYGEHIHNKIVMGFSGAGDRSNQAFIDFIKKNTSADVFDHFGSWYNENQARIY